MALLAWYPLNGNVDNYGCGDLDLTQTTAPTYAAGIVGRKSLSTGAFKWTAAQTASIFNNTAVSYACWFYVDAADGTSASDYKKIFGAEGGTDYINRKFTIGQYSTVNDLHASSWNGTKLISCCLINDCLPSYKWTHICVTYRTGTMSFYINGVLKGTQSITMNNSSYSAETPVIWNYSGRRIADVRAYNHCLSLKEVKELARGLCLHYPMNSIGGLTSQPNIVLTHTMKNGTTTHAGSRMTKSCSVVYDASTESGWAFKETLTTSTDYTSANGGYYFLASQVIGSLDKLTSGETYTYSVSIRASRPCTMNGAQNIVESQTFVSSVPYTTGGDISVGTAYQRYSFTFRFTNTSKFTTCYYANTGAAGDTVTVWVADPKLEPGTHDTGFIPNTADPVYKHFSSTQCVDDSGMGNDGTWYGSPALAADTARYGLSTKFVDGCYINGIPDPLSSSTSQCSISCWVKTTSTADTCLWTGRSTAGKEFALFILNGKVNFDDNVRTAGATSVNTGSWVHIVATFALGGKKRIYVNGVKDLETTASTALTKSNTTGSIGKLTTNGTVGGAQLLGNLSDFRIYATELSADDVLSLYKTSTSMDDMGKLHSGCMIESDGIAKVSMTRTGNVYADSFNEIALKYDSKVYVEPDGSMWVRAFHHNAPAGNPFASTDTFTTGVYGNDTRWFNMGICNYMDKWEIIYEERDTSSSADVYRFRWKQNVNPMTATFDNTKAANITKFTLDDGYSTIGSSYGGMYRSTIGSTYLCCNNGASNNWFGAVGMYVQNWSSGANPGYNGRTISSGYVDIYVRIDNVTITGLDKSGFSMNKTDASVSATLINEV